MRKYILSVTLILGCAVLAGYAAGEAASEVSVQKKCPACGMEVKADWLYCPYDGVSLKVQDIEKIPRRSAREVLLAFYKGYRNKDKKLLAECIDLEYILADILRKGIDNIEGLSGGMRTTFKAELIPIASKSLVSGILEVMVSEAMQKEFPIPDEISSKAIDAFYEMKEQDRIVRFIPLKGVGTVDDQIVLRNVKGRWFIVEMPGI